MKKSPTRRVRKRLPEGAVPARDLSTEARAGGALDPTWGRSGADAQGPRPNPGPLPTVADDERFMPLRWQFPYAFNQIWTPRRQALTPFSILRQLADVSDLIRICIETRKDQMTSLGWDIAPRDKKQSDTLARKINTARTFFRKPDKRRSFSTWLRTAIEDVLVVDALSIYRRRSRDPQFSSGDGKVVNGLYALELKDGTTFLPLLDPDTGDTPLPPNVAYRQIIFGQPMVGGDCTTEQLYYQPRTVRTHTPYGLSPTEAILLTVNAALNRSMFNLQYYTEGNVPEGLLEAPQGFTTKQLIEFQQYIDDYLGGDLGKRRRLKVVHTGAAQNLKQFKEPEFKTDWDEWIVKVVCAAMAVPPQEIGFTGDVNRATGQMQENVTYRRGVKPLGAYFKDLFDEILAIDMALPELEWVWTGGEPEDKLVQAQTDEIYVRIGKTSIDELRARDGQEPIGLGPYVDTAMGPVFVDELLAGGKPDDDPTTTDRGDNPDPPAAGHGEPPASDEELSEGAVEDLRRWRAIAIKAVKAKKPVRRFASQEIPPELHARIVRFLKLAEKKHDVGAVVAAFELALLEHQAVRKEATEVRKLTALERRSAKAIRRYMAGYFKRQGKAFAEHVAKELPS